MSTATQIMGLEKLCGLYNIIKCNGGLTKLLRQLYRTNELKCGEFIEEELTSSYCKRYPACSPLVKDNAEENVSLDTMMSARLLKWLNYITKDCRRPYYHWMFRQTDYLLDTSSPYLSYSKSLSWQPPSAKSIILQLPRCLDLKLTGHPQIPLQLKDNDPQNYKYPCPVIDSIKKKNPCKAEAKGTCNSGGKGKKREIIKKGTKKKGDSCGKSKESCGGGSSNKKGNTCGKAKDPCGGNSSNKKGNTCGKAKDPCGGNSSMKKGDACEKSKYSCEGDSSMKKEDTCAKSKETCGGDSSKKGNTCGKSKETCGGDSSKKGNTCGKSKDTCGGDSSKKKGDTCGKSKDTCGGDHKKSKDPCKHDKAGGSCCEDMELVDDEHTQKKSKSHHKKKNKGKSNKRGRCKRT